MTKQHKCDTISPQNKLRISQSHVENFYTWQSLKVVKTATKKRESVFLKKDNEEKKYHYVATQQMCEILA